MTDIAPGDLGSPDARNGPLRGAAMVVAEQAAEAFATGHCTVTRTDATVGFDQVIPDPLMVPFAVIVGEVLADRATERSFTEEDHSIEALLLD